MRALLLLSALLRCSLAFFRSHNEQVIVELALRQQLATCARKQSKPKLTPLDRAFWVALSRLWSPWRDALVIVKPDTVLRWHRKGFRLYWRSISTHGSGRPPISEKIQTLICRLATENGWRARKIQAELLKLGLAVSLATVSRYLPRREPDHGSRQRWATFLRNHEGVIAGMDFFVVPTLCFRLLYVWFVLDHVIVFHEPHLRRLMRDYADYYNADRVHTELRDSPVGRQIERRPSADAAVIGLPRLGGLHHRYIWQEAA